MFIKNCWYAAGMSNEIQSGPLARTIINEPIVLYRKADGHIAALEDRCCHRGLPLAHGQVLDGLMQCGYHGLVFDHTGQCVRIPGQEKIPQNARIKSYPVVEQDALIWVWMGDPAKADPAQILRYPWHSDPEWAYDGKYTSIDANYQLLYDNLLDLTHVGYVHRNTIGGEPEAHSNAEMKTTRSDDGVHVIRWLRNSTPPPLYASAFEFHGKVDRWIEIEFSVGAVRIYSGAKDVGQGAYEGNREGGLGLRTLHAVTPSTEDSTFYFWTVARNFKLKQPEVGEKICQEIEATFNEDKAILESQHQRLKAQAGRPLVDIAADAGAIQARRIIASRIAAEVAKPQTKMTDIANAG